MSKIWQKIFATAIASAAAFASGVSHAAIIYSFDAEAQQGYRSISFSFSSPDFITTPFSPNLSDTNCVATGTACTGITFESPDGLTGIVEVGLADATPPA